MQFVHQKMQEFSLISLILNKRQLLIIIVGDLLKEFNLLFKFGLLFFLVDLIRYVNARLLQINSLLIFFTFLLLSNSTPLKNIIDILKLSLLFCSLINQAGYIKRCILWHWLHLFRFIISFDAFLFQNVLFEIIIIVQSA